MKPLLFADWRLINRAFSFFTWMLALALALVILGHFVSASATCTPSSQGLNARPCKADGSPLRPVPR